VTYEIRDMDHLNKTDELYLHMQKLLSENNLNEAENLLFDMLDAGDYDYLVIALDFYTKINQLDNVELKKADFSREEIESGLNELKRIYGIFF
jgi:glutamate mutase epsilon subunit